MADTYHLQRFLDAQERDYARAYQELQQGKKRTHWMWYIFPQFAGLGFSATSRFYAIQSEAEARAYLQHPLLGSRLQRCMEALLAIQGRSPYDILGSPDDQKLQSCATLFAAISPSPSIFQQILDRYYQGKSDPKTLALLYPGSNL